MERLLELYRRCLLERMSLWFSDPILIEASGELAFTVRRASQSAVLGFEPAACRWRLQLPEGDQHGSFDRMSKRLRQYFSGTPLA